MYSYSIKESKEDGKRIFVVEITCDESKKEKEVVKEIRYTSKIKGKPIIAKSVATGVEIRFDSIKQASQMIVSDGTSKTREKRIGECLNGKGKTYLGYTWRYAK